MTQGKQQGGMNGMMSYNQNGKSMMNGMNSNTQAQIMQMFNQVQQKGNGRNETQ